MANTSARQRHEVRDEAGNLIAVLEIVSDEDSEPAATMIELAADLPGCGYRLRIFPGRAKRWQQAA